MTAPQGNTPDGSSRVGGSDTGTAGRHGRADTPASGTSVGANVHDRMTGTETVVTPTRGADGVEHRYKPAKTSAAATFALVFGLAALFCALTAILSPFALLFGLLGIILGIVGIKMAKRPGVTGKGVAIGGLVTAVLGLLLGGAVIAGAAAFVNDEANLDRLQTEIDKVLENAPSTDELRDEAPAS